MSKNNTTKTALEFSEEKMAAMIPRVIVETLDKHIVGQDKAKRAVAIALRNRWRRRNVEPEELRKEITPKNILMIGPTGVGKTEIARRMAMLSNAPFIKVEATKFTEVGYVGRDVDTIIRDLMEVSIKDTKEFMINSVRENSTKHAIEKIIDILLDKEGFASKSDIMSHMGMPDPKTDDKAEADTKEESEDSLNAKRDALRKDLEEGKLDDVEIEIESFAKNHSMEIFAPPGMEDLTGQIQNMFQSIMGQKKSIKKLTVREALRFLEDDETSSLINDDDVKAQAVYNAEQNGIVFIDEIDKVASKGNEMSSNDVSRQGVQRDLLPLIEGTSVSTKYGMVKTDHILFIACGSFHSAKPSDLIPELQGRLPIRVTLNSLTISDFEKILSSTDSCISKQHKALLETEGININFSKCGIKRLAEIASSNNEDIEDIGARRLHSIMEVLLESVSFMATENEVKEILIDKEYVDNQLKGKNDTKDYSNYMI